MILAETTAPKVPKWPSDGNFLQGHPKPAFSEKVQSGDQEKVFKNRPKKSTHRLKGLKAHWRKWHYRLISTHLKCKDWKRFWRKKRLRKVSECRSYCNFCKVKQWVQRCPNGQVMAIFERSSKTRMFGKKAKGRPRETFKKSPKKYPSLQRAKSTLARMSLSCNLYPLIVQRIEKILAEKAAPKVLEWPSDGNFGKITQNQHFLKKERRGDQRIFFKHRLKTGPHLKGPEAL